MNLRTFAILSLCSFIVQITAQYGAVKTYSNPYEPSAYPEYLDLPGETPSPSVNPKLVSLTDLESVYEKFLHIVPRNSRVLDEGAGDGLTQADNTEAFRRLVIQPQIGRDVSYRSLATNVLGKPVSLPIGIGAVSMQKLADPNKGEIASALAAEKQGTIYIHPSLATVSIEDLAYATPYSRKWQTVPIFRNRTITTEFILRAERNGFEAIVVPTGPFFSQTMRNATKYNFYLPPQFKLANFKDPDLQNLFSNQTNTKNPLQLLYDVLFDPTADWDTFKLLTRVSRLPVIAGLVGTPEEAELAIRNGAKGILVSNNEGALYDGAPPSIEVLPSIVKQAYGRAEIYFGSGVVSGADVFKALALGARNVFIYRPVYWGLVVASEEGVEWVFSILHDELDQAMAYAGVNYIEDIVPEFIQKSRNICPRKAG